jgi:hypothetical protein
MLISYDLWQRRFNGTPDILGKRLRVADFGGNDTPSTIIGVAPPGFVFANAQSDYFVPLRATGRGRGSPARNRDVVARLKDGVTLEQAQAAANQLAVGFEEASRPSYSLSPAQTSAVFCWHRASRDNASSPCAQPSAPDAGASSVSC